MRSGSSQTSMRRAPPHRDAHQLGEVVPPVRVLRMYQRSDPLCAMRRFRLQSLDERARSRSEADADTLRARSPSDRQATVRAGSACRCEAADETRAGEVVE